ncbi:MAG TPA: AAA family ATPase [Candidatus Acidoferrales bacterium]|nr:AAA family ATPase [Candidatus Acidoferrales bacterium]
MKLLTRAQIHLSVPHERRDGKYLCPVCKKWHLTIGKGDTPDFSCKTPECQGKGGHDRIVKRLWEPVERLESKRNAGDSGNDEAPSGSLSLVEYATEKNLSAPYLQEWFVATEGPHPNYKAVTKAVCFPYLNERGEEVTQQWRWGMGKGKRRWLYDKPTYLYGGRHLQNLERMAELGAGVDTIFLVEGESNTHTLSQRFPTLGLPGVGTWKPEWANLKLFQEARRIYFFLDMKFENGKWLPEAVALKGARKVADSFLPGKVLAVQLSCKDVSDLWLQCTDDLGGGPDRFLRDLNNAVLDAQPVIPVAKTDAPVSEIDLVSADEVEPTLLEWLWPDRIPLGKPTVFYGLPDQGKSTVAIDIIARGSAGKPFPDRPNPLGVFDTIVLAQEDDQDDTYVPRLMAAGADLKHVHFADMVLSGSETQADRLIALDKDIASLERLLEKNPATRLLVIDPISAYLGEKDQNKDKEVRPLLQQIRELSKRTRVTVIALMHFNKNSDQAAIHRASGAGAWAQVPRALWAFVPAPVDEEVQGQDIAPEHLMLSAKLNLTRRKDGLRYDFESVSVRVKNKRTGEMVESSQPRIKWLGNSTATLDDVMKEKHAPGPEAVKTKAAMDWLEKFLTGGPKPSAEIEKAAVAEGHSKKVLWNAKERLNIEARRDPPGKGLWYWRLPTNSVAPET